MNIKDLVSWKRNNGESNWENKVGDGFFSLQKEINKMFEDFSRPFLGVPSLIKVHEDRFISPRVDMSENDKSVQVTTELPGMDEKDIEVNISRDVLTIRGEKKVEKEDVGKEYYLMERSYGSFHRTIPLPVEVDADKIEANFKNGILKVTLPKSASAKSETKRISIKRE